MKIINSSYNETSETVDEKLILYSWETAKIQISNKIKAAQWFYIIKSISHIIFILYLYCILFKDRILEYLMDRVFNG